MYANLCIFGSFSGGFRHAKIAYSSFVWVLLAIFFADTVSAMAEIFFGLKFCPNEKVYL